MPKRHLAGLLIWIVMIGIGQQASSESLSASPASTPTVNPDSTLNANPIPIAATTNNEAGKEILDINEEQNGGVVAMVANDVVRIQIEGNPTTGFTWEPEHLDNHLLAQIGERKFTPNNNLKGGEGVFAFTFKALKPGVTHLRLIYHRSFEKDVPAARIFDVVVDIQHNVD